MQSLDTKFLAMEKPTREMLPGLSKILEDFFSESEFPKDVIENTKRMILYVIPDHFLSSTPFIFPKFCKILRPNLTVEELELAESLGWISQMFQSYCLAFDDFFDDGEQRFDKVTWSKLHRHSKSAILPDLVILRSVAFFILKKKFSHLSSIYIQLLQLCVDSEILYYKGIQLEKELHFEGIREGKNYLESSNIESYRLSCTLINDPFLNLPVAMAMTLCGFQMSEHRELHHSLVKICNNYCSLGKFADDYLEIFGPSSSIDRTDEDFRKGRISWLFLMAKKSCVSTGQLGNLLKHYGNDNNDFVIYLTELLEKIGIHDVWKQTLNNTFDDIKKELNAAFVGYPEVKKFMTAYIDYLNEYMCLETDTNWKTQ